jgi:hypothetical protein
MTKNLFDLTYELASELGIVTFSYVTASTSHKAISDTVMLTEDDDHWNKGTLWLTHDAGGAGAEPQGKMGAISDFVNSTNLILLSVDLSTAMAVATDEYAVADQRFPLGDLKMAINRAVRDVGSIPVTNTTAMDTVAAQTEYTLPIAANHDLREVWVETNISDSNDNRWAKVTNWSVDRTDVGTADTLIFGYQPAYPRDVKLVYMSPHVRLAADSDELSESIPYERVVYRAAVHAMTHYGMKTHEDGDWFMSALSKYERRADEADRKYPIKSPKKRPKGLALGRTKTRELAPGENTL